MLDDEQQRIMHIWQPAAERSLSYTSQVTVIHFQFLLWILVQFERGEQMSEIRINNLYLTHVSIEKWISVMVYVCIYGTDTSEPRLWGKT